MENNSVGIEIRSCAKTYADGTRGLRATDLQIEPGEVLALLGPSGCGKTTLLRIIAGLETADAGSRVCFGDTDVTHLPIERREVGMVFQHYALFPHMTVQANIGYGLRIRGVAAAEQQRVVGELVDLVRLNGLEHKRPAELSGGQRQRVALARAVASRPRVLLLDEPLTALDAKLKEQLRDELAQLLRQLRITAVHVTHDQREALAIADRLAVMQGGQILQVGDGETLYRRPAHPFVARFLGRVNQVMRSAQDAAANHLTLGGVAVPCDERCRAAERLLVRPEDICVGPAHQPGTVPATVTRRVFLGDHLELALAIPGQPALLAEVSRDHVAQAGECVGLAIAPHNWMPDHPTP